MLLFRFSMCFCIHCGEKIECYKLVFVQVCFLHLITPRILPIGIISGYLKLSFARHCSHPPTAVSSQPDDTLETKAGRGGCTKRSGMAGASGFVLFSSWSNPLERGDY